MKSIHKLLSYQKKLSRKKRYIGININISKKNKNRLNVKKTKKVSNVYKGGRIFKNCKGIRLITKKRSQFKWNDSKGGVRKHQQDPPQITERQYTPIVSRTQGTTYNGLFPHKTNYTTQPKSTIQTTKINNTITQNQTITLPQYEELSNNLNTPWYVARHGVFKSLEISPNGYSFTYKKKNEDGKTFSYNGIGYTPIVLSIDLLQFYVNNQLIELTPDNKIKINSKAIIMGETEVSYKKGGTKYDDVFEDSNDDEKNKIEGYKMLTYEESLKNFFNIDNYIRTKIIDEKTKQVSEFKLYHELVWVTEIMRDLNTINKDTIHNLDGKCNLDLFLDRKEQGKEQGTDQSKVFGKDERIFTKCDLNVDHNKLIIEKHILGDETYIILGYPDMSMFPYLKLYEENEMEFESVYDKHKNEQNKNGMSGILSHIADLNNYLYKEEDKQIKTIDDIDKFFGKNTYYEKYVSEYYDRIVENFTELFNKPKPKENQINTKENQTNTKENKTNENKTKEQELLLSFLNKKFNDEYGIDYNAQFKKDFLEKQKEYYNTLAKQYLNKPMRYIKYNFIVFKEINDYDNGKETIFKKTFDYPIKYVPAIFNFRELKGKHITLLQELKNCIYKKLSKMYGITNTDDEEYMLFYSTYKYGTFFHIKTEYLHTLANMFQTSYKYQITITLEELYYMVSLLDDEENFETLRVDYKKRAQTILKERDNAFLHNNLLKKKSKKSKKSKHAKKITLKTTCDKYDIKPSTENLTELNKQFNDNHTNITILLLFRETGNKYTCIYKYVNNETNVIIFYLLQFISNLCSLEKEFNILNTQDHSKYNMFECGFIKQYLIKNSNEIALFKIIKHCKLTIEDYKSYLYYNPIFSKNFYRINKKDNFLNINNFFQIPKINMNMPNIYKIKSIFLRNYLGTNLYKTEFLKFKKKILTGNIEHIFERQLHSESINIENLDNPKRIFNITNEEKDSKDNIIEGNKGLINKIYFNPGNCKYNFIEIYETINNTYKFIVWIVPLNATDSESHEDNFEDFKSIFIKDEKYPTYIGNFLDLNNTHIKMLEQIKKLYLKQNFVCSVNIQSVSPLYYCLHFHIMSDYIYKNYISKNELGLRMFSILHINRILNNIKWNSNYYNSIDMNILTC